ncbi:hypothetical protein FHR92_002309 [Fontibacillus solani]|uniref:DUF7408 domain-containing protein n=1 Tax=Fontibacillus solani TaxID=1572857 RepID=A0A7W3ST96_9BACL|nr:hypothetical protein [Fontibacillus solani]MBA9085842.1 hypothetical protein [Fontibacillus solani]
MVGQLKRIIPMFVLITMIAAGLWGAAPAYVSAAEPAISIETEVGYGENYKENEWTPITITLKSDTDISGEIVVRAELPYMQGSVSQIKQVDLPAGTPKKITVGVIGNNFTKDNTTIRFYSGSAESGKYIPFSSGKAYLQSTFNQGAVIGVLASDPDTMNFLRALNDNGRNVTVTSLKGDQLPNDGQYLSSLDVLVVNNYSMDTSTEGQLAAISDWVKRGGTLVLAGGAGYTKSVKGLEALSPVEFTGTTEVNALPELASLGGKALSIDHPLTISTATLKDTASTILSNGNEPLFASWSVGKGEVLYAAYDVSQDPLDSWSGHAGVWGSVLSKKLLSNAAFQGGNYKYAYVNFRSGMDYLLDYFPSLTFPPFSRLFWIFIAYALVVAPALYYFLKKLDKREWAWVCIPVIAIVASVGIYFAGTTGKTNVRTHTINVMELDGNGYAKRTTASSLFVPRGGKYELQFAAGTHVTLKREDGLITGNSLSNSAREFVREQEDATDVKLLDMTHRSIAKVWVDQAENREFGKLDIVMTYDEKGQPQGTITNNTDRNFSNTALIVGGDLYMIGNLEKNQSSPIPSNKIPVRYGNYGDTAFPYTGNNRNDPHQRERGLMNNYLGSNSESNNVIIAWDQAAISDYKVNGKEVPTEQLNMWVQQIQPQFVNDKNEIQVPFGYIRGAISNSTASEWSQDSSIGINMSEGDMDFEYNLTAVGHSANLSELNIRQQNNGQRTTAMIWNNTMNNWEPLTWVNGQVVITEKVDDYIQNGSRLLIRITASEWTSFDMPEISLKGKMSR